MQYEPIPAFVYIRHSGHGERAELCAAQMLVLLRMAQLAYFLGRLGTQ
jgi:hypothetical protein